MNITQTEFREKLQTTGSPALNLQNLPRKVEALAIWFFMRQEENEVSALVREYLAELDEHAYVSFVSELPPMGTFFPDDNLAV